MGWLAAAWACWDVLLNMLVSSVVSTGFRRTFESSSSRLAGVVCCCGCCWGCCCTCWIQFRFVLETTLIFRFVRKKNFLKKFMHQSMQCFSTKQITKENSIFNTHAYTVHNYVYSRNCWLECMIYWKIDFWFSFSFFIFCLYGAVARCLVLYGVRYLIFFVYA